MTRPLHGRRARRAQWLRDAAELRRVHLMNFYGAEVSPEDIGTILRAESAAKRARRIAARRSA